MKTHGLQFPGHLGPQLRPPLFGAPPSELWRPPLVARIPASRPVLSALLRVIMPPAPCSTSPRRTEDKEENEESESPARYLVPTSRIRKIAHASH